MFMSAPQKVTEPFARRLPSDLRDRVGQRDLLGTCLDAVLRVAAVRDAARPHERVEALVAVERAGRVEVHQQRLPDGRGADEATAPPHLRADLETEPARDAAIERVAL